MTFAQYAEFAVVIGFGLGLAATSLWLVIWVHRVEAAHSTPSAVSRG